MNTPRGELPSPGTDHKDAGLPASGTRSNYPRPTPNPYASNFEIAFTVSLAIVGWLGGWLALGALPSYVPSNLRPQGSEAMIFYDGIVFGHIFSLPSVCGAATHLAPRRFGSPLWKGPAIAVAHFLLGLLLLLLTFSFGLVLSILVGLVYTIFGWKWASALARRLDLRSGFEIPEEEARVQP